MVLTYRRDAADELDERTRTGVKHYRPTQKELSVRERINNESQYMR